MLEMQTDISYRHMIVEITALKPFLSADNTSVLITLGPHQEMICASSVFLLSSMV